MQQFTVIDVLIPSGQKSFTTTELPEDGKVFKVAFYTDDTPSQTVSIGIYDNGNKAIHPPVHYKEFVPTNGNHLDSKKDLVFTGGRKIKVTANADDNLSADFKGQLLFLIEGNNI